MLSLRPICGDEWVTSAATKYTMNPRMNLKSNDFIVNNESGEIALKVESRIFKVTKALLPMEEMPLLSSSGDVLVTLKQVPWRSSFTMHIKSGERVLATIKMLRMTSTKGSVYAGDETFSMWNCPNSGAPPILNVWSSAGESKTKALALETKIPYTNAKFYKGDSFAEADMVACTHIAIGSLETTQSLEISAGQDSALILAVMLSLNEMMEGALRNF